MCHSSKSVTCVKFKESSYDRSSTCERKREVGINTISPISIDRSTLINSVISIQNVNSHYLWCYSVIHREGVMLGGLP